MRLLLDTHTLIWAANNSLPKSALSIINDTSNDLYFSPINIWEIELKQSRLKIDPRKFYEKLIENGYRELRLTTHHILSLSKLPAIHSDPFDRVLLAQAYAEEMPLFTSDEIICKYSQTLDCVLFYE